MTGRHVVVDRLWHYVEQVTNIYRYLKHSERQWVSQLEFVNDESASTTALHIDTGEGVQLRVHPVEPLVQQVWGEIGGGGVNRSDQLDPCHLHEWIKKNPT